MKSLLLVIDLQKAFINNNTEFLIDKINKLLNKNMFDNIIFTKFINSQDSVWFKNLNYKECLDDESREIQIDCKNYKVISKKIYSAFDKEVKEYIEKNDISKIYLCGIDTECCILKTALDMFENGYDVYVLNNYCASMKGKKRHKNAIEILKRNIGYDKIV